MMKEMFALAYLISYMILCSSYFDFDMALFWVKFSVCKVYVSQLNGNLRLSVREIGLLQSNGDQRKTSSDL